jgi:hypothetical protein
MENDLFYFGGAALNLLAVCPVSISSMIDTIKRPPPMSLVPFSCIRAKSCRPVSSTNETLDRSTRISPVAVTRSQHFSSSSTQGPASFPSTTKQVTLESALIVILSTTSISVNRDGKCLATSPEPNKPRKCSNNGWTAGRGGPWKRESGNNSRSRVRISSALLM